MPRHLQLSISIQPLHDLSHLTRCRLCFPSCGQLLFVLSSRMLHRLVEITPFGYRHDVLSIFKTDHLKGSEEFFPWVEVFHAIHRAYTHQNRTVRRQPLHTVGMNKNIKHLVRSSNDNRSFQSLSICNRCSRINQSHKNCFLLAMVRTNNITVLS